MTWVTELLVSKLQDLRDCLYWDEERKAAFLRADMPEKFQHLLQKLHGDGPTNHVLYELIYHITNSLITFFGASEEEKSTVEHDPTVYVEQCLTSWAELKENQLRWLCTVPNSFYHVENNLNRDHTAFQGVLYDAIMDHVESITRQLLDLLYEREYDEVTP